MELKNDLYSINNKLIIKATQRINKKTLGIIIKKNKPIRFIRLEQTFVAADLKKALKVSRYKVILQPENINLKVAAIINRTLLPETVFSELKNIKKNMQYTYQHILLTAILSTKISMDNNLKNIYDPVKMARLGIVHDIGKSRIPFKILNKTTPLTIAEHKILQDHPVIGYLLLNYYCGDKHHLYDCAAFEHHERLDGSGYPQKLKKINKYSQVIAVVDVFDALLSKRPYRKNPYTLRCAIDLLLDNVSQGKLNKKIVYILISYARASKPPIKELKVSTKKSVLA
ncbi:MAG: HD domain-containing protein [Candidatus Omnitrophica bacterium]|nr:HD domain-containing protein [Candidatus Omnitrophota bacterium]